MPRKRVNPNQIWPRIRPVTNKDGSTSYQIDTRMAGKGERMTYKTKVEAQTAAEQARIKRRNEGGSAFSMEAVDRLDAERALNVLRSHGLSLRQAADFAVKHLSAATTPRRIPQVAEELLEKVKRDGYSGMYHDNLKSIFKRFAASFPGMNIGDVRAASIDEWLRNYPGIINLSRNSYHLRLTTLFDYAVKKKYAVDNPCKEVEFARVEQKMPEILTIPQAIALLEKAHPNFMPCLLLGLFAGLRPLSEICRLRWERINFETKKIYIAPGCTKNKKSVRFVDMSDNLIEWLLPFRQSAGLVVPTIKSYLHGRRRTFVAAGLQLPACGETRGVRIRTAGMIDVLRHTYCSMHLAKHENLDKLKYQMGHSSTSEMVFNHYRVAVERETAETYWKIRPNFSEEAILQRGITLAKLLDLYLQNLLPERQKNDSRTKEMMRYYCARSACGKFCGRFPNMFVSNVQSLHVEEWLTSLQFCPSTASASRSYVSGMFKFAIERGFTLSNPAIHNGQGPFFGVVRPTQSNIIQMAAA